MKNKETEYIRVGTSLYRRVQKPMQSKKEEHILIPWSIEAIKQDYPNTWKTIIKDMERYNGFYTFPEHQNYVRNFKGYYNLYDPITVQPESGSCATILKAVQHIFGEQYELGLDYLQLLYSKPLQKLPVLCLVSKERETGKTTFLNLLKNIFGNNMTFNTNEDFRSNFNADWVSKLIVAIDEVLLDKKEDSERIKNLSTAKTYKTEAKGKDKYEVDYFGKIILSSNNEDNFMVIGTQETRYWVRKILPLEKQDPDFEMRMTREIPQFLYFLNQRKLSTKIASRMWFTEKQIFTEALRKVKSSYVNKIELELYEIIKEIMEIQELKEFSFINLNIKTLLDRSGHRVSRSYIRKILEEKWELVQYPNASTYFTFQYDLSGMLYQVEGKGRYYTIKQEDLERINVAMLTL